MCIDLVVSGEWYQVSSIKYQVSSIKYQVFFPTCGRDFF